jgi:chorismate mutase
MRQWDTDPVVVELRARIAEADRAILERVNERIELVARVRRHKEERGYPFVDSAQEDSLIARLCELNQGPLSAEGVRELFSELLDLVKREVTQDRAPA